MCVWGSSCNHRVVWLWWTWLVVTWTSPSMTPNRCSRSFLDRSRSSSILRDLFRSLLTDPHGFFFLSFSSWGAFCLFFLSSDVFSSPCLMNPVVGWLHPSSGPSMGQCLERILLYLCKQTKKNIHSSVDNIALLTHRQSLISVLLMVTTGSGSLSELVRPWGLGLFTEPFGDNLQDQNTDKSAKEREELLPDRQLIIMGWIRSDCESAGENPGSVLLATLSVINSCFGGDAWAPAATADMPTHHLNFHTEVLTS